MKKKSLACLTVAVALMGLAVVKVDINKEVAGQIGEPIIHSTRGARGIVDILGADREVAGQIGEPIIHSTRGASGIVDFL